MEGEACIAIAYPYSTLRQRNPTALCDLPGQRTKILVTLLHGCGVTTNCAVRPFE